MHIEWSSANARLYVAYVHRLLFATCEGKARQRHKRKKCSGTVLPKEGRGVIQCGLLEEGFVRIVWGLPCGMCGRSIERLAKAPPTELTPNLSSLTSGFPEIRETSQNSKLSDPERACL